MAINSLIYTDQFETGLVENAVPLSGEGKCPTPPSSGRARA